MLAPAPTISRLVLPRATLRQDALLILFFSALTGLAAQAAVWLPFSPVPITGQTLAVLLAGALLGSRRGALSQLTYLVEGALGLPVFAGGAGGVAWMLGPTGGYLAGFVAAAFAVGWLAERGWDRRVPTAAAAMLVGSLAIYLLGLLWLALLTGLPLDRVLDLGLYRFLPGDAVKITLAAGALPGGWAILRHGAAKDLSRAR